MFLIPLTRGLHAIVDPEDSGLAEWKWQVYQSRPGTVYAGRSIWRDGKTVAILMHREIVNAPPGLQVDHINHDTLDNRRSNLRLATRSQNQGNRRMNANNLTGFKGVRFDRSRNRWIAKIGNCGGGGKRLGRFRTAEEAARAYDLAAIERYGDFALLNFPEESHPRSPAIIAS